MAGNSFLFPGFFSPRSLPFYGNATGKKKKDLLPMNAKNDRRLSKRKGTPDTKAPESGREREREEFAVVTLGIVPNSLRTPPDPCATPRGSRKEASRISLTEAASGLSVEGSGSRIDYLVSVDGLPTNLSVVPSPGVGRRLEFSDKERDAFARRALAEFCLLEDGLALYLRFRPDEITYELVPCYEDAYVAQAPPIRDETLVYERETVHVRYEARPAIS